MRRTKSGLPRYCSWQYRDGCKRRVRFRKGGTLVYLPGSPWSEPFMRAYAAALDGVAAPAEAIGAGRILPGSVNELIASYRNLVFPTLAHSTQRNRRGILETFGREHGNKRVAHLEHEHVAAIVAAKKDTPDAANSLRKVLRLLLEHAIEIRMIAHNPAARVKRLKITGRGFHTWSDAEIAQYRAFWPLGTQQRLAMELALETTSRRADLTRIGPQHIRGDRLDLRHTKNDAEAFIPITPELRAAIDAMPRPPAGTIAPLSFLHTRNGTPRSPNGLGGDFRRWCDAAGLPKHCSLHGLRKGGARRLAEAGASTKEIQSITGHKTLSEVQRYVDAADKAKLAEQAIAKLQTATSRSQTFLKIGHQSNPVSKKGS
jgi:integrase